MHPETIRTRREAGNDRANDRANDKANGKADTPEAAAWSRADFEAKLRERGRSYHIHHPFNVMLNAGRATPAQVRGWVANRFYYQIAIPIKDAAVMSNCPDREVRRGWVQRILDHDGFELNGVRDEGGIEAWLRLARAVGLTRDEVIDQRHVIPALRFAVDAYVNFARRAPWQEAVCSSLTELFAPEIHKQRLASWPEHYTWIEPEGMAYFRNRVSQARRDKRMTFPNPMLVVVSGPSGVGKSTIGGEAGTRSSAGRADRDRHDARPPTQRDRQGALPLPVGGRVREAALGRRAAGARQRPRQLVRHTDPAGARHPRCRPRWRSWCPTRRERARSVAWCPMPCSSLSCRRRSMT